MINFTFFADLKFWFREYFLIIWPEITDFKPICFTFLDERCPDTGSELGADREPRERAEEIIEKS
ncbi:MULTISPECIES: hypothetical protein [Methanosarcina]|uniref:hypothetical protein n=1 Tax=Methanosarcina TaxID=2207 RepID=UPI001E2DAA60|nr:MULTISPECIES: hypothetical protein [Methanosarcina]